MNHADIYVRIRDLSAIAANLADERSGGWLANAMAEDLSAELQAEQEAKATTADRLTQAGLSGLTGLRLMQALRPIAAKASRDDFVFAVALIVTSFEADRIGLLADLHAAWRQIDGLQRQLAGSAVTA